jgi:hypothetical protein
MFKQLVNYIHYNVDELKLKFAIHMAIKAHNQNGKRYFVMPDEKDRLIIMHRPSFRKLKHDGQMSYSAKVSDLIRESFYFTPYSSRNVEMEAITPEIQEAKRLMFHRYMRASRIRKKNAPHLPFFTRLQIRLKILTIQYKMAIR